jgi:hypothetical protein
VSVGSITETSDYDITVYNGNVDKVVEEFNKV